MRSKAATGAARAARASRGRSTVTRTRVAPRDALVRQPEAQVGRPAAQWPQAGPRPAWPQGMQGLGTMFLFGAAFSAAAGIVAAMEPHGEVLTVSEDEAVREADELYEDPATTPVQLLRYLRSRTEGAAHVPAALRWRLARALSDTAEALDKSDPRKKELLREALEQSKAAVAQDDGSFAAHKWCGIALSRWGEYEGTKVKIENAYAIREHFERACELNPGDATSRHLLGRCACAGTGRRGWELVGSALTRSDRPQGAWTSRRSGGSAASWPPLCSRRRRSPRWRRRYATFWRCVRGALGERARV